MKSRSVFAFSIVALLPLAARAQTITTFNTRAAFEAAMGNFKVVDDFSLGGTFLDVTTNNGAINGAAKWADIARNPEPSTIWATPFGSTAFGGTWDTTVAGVGGGLAFELDFGGGTIVTVPGNVAGNAPANTFFGFIADQAFFNVRTRQFDSVGGTLQETHTLDDLTVQVTANFADARFVQAGAGVWDTAGHWDIGAVPGSNQRVFITPTGGAVVSGPTAATSVRQLVLGDGTAASRLNLDAAGTLTVARGAVVKANSTVGGAGRLLGALTMAAGSTLTVADGQTLQVGAAAVNGFSTAGTITVGTGTLILEDTDAIALGTLTTLAGGTLSILGGTAEVGTGDTLRGQGVLTGAFDLQSTGQIRAQGGTLNIARLTMSGGTLRAETGNLQVAQLTATAGTVTVDAARTLDIASTNTAGFSTVSVGAGGTLSAAGQLQSNVGTTLGAGATLSGAAGLSLGGTLSHAGAQVFNAGTGDLTINSFSFTAEAADSLLGSRLVLSGTTATLGFSSDATLGTAGNQIVLQGGRLFPQANLTLPSTRSVEVTVGNGSIIALAGRSVTVEGNISGAGQFVLTGSSGGLFGGTVRLTGTNTQAGGTDIAGVTLEIASDTNLGGPNGVLLIGRENGFTDIPGRLRALGNLEIPATRSTTFRLARVDTNGFDVTFNQPVTGQDLIKEGAGVLRFNTANTFNSGVNDLNIQGGIVRSGVNEAFGRPRVFLSGTTLDLNGFTQTVSTLSGPGEVKLGNGGALTVIGGAGSPVEAIISGVGSVNFGQAPFVANLYRVLGENTFAGTVTVTAGNSVSIKAVSAFGAAGNSVLLDNGGIFSDFEAPGAVVIGATFPMTIGAGGAFFGANGKSLIVEALLAGSVPIGVRGGGADHEVRFANPANTFTSQLAIGNGTFGSAVLGIVADGSLGNAANIVTLGYQFFDGETMQTGTGTLRAFADIVFPAGRTLRMDGDDGDGGGVFDTNGFNMTVGAPLTELHPDTPLLKTGAGKVTLVGANTYTGTTSVDEGTLVVSGSISGETRVLSSGTLSGTGVVGDVRMSFGGTLAPGDSAGTLHTGDVTLGGGSIFALEFASPTLGDQLDVTGGVTLNGDVELSLTLGYTPAGVDTFIVILNDGTDSIERFGNTTFFTIGGERLSEGEFFTAAGAGWTISYAGGNGNDVTLTVVPEPGSITLLLGGLALLGWCRRRA